MGTLNKRCRCGSGRKARNCCLKRERAAGPGLTMDEVAALHGGSDLAGAFAEAPAPAEAVCVVCDEAANTFSTFGLFGESEADALFISCDREGSCPRTIMQYRGNQRHIVHFDCLEGLDCVNQTRRQELIAQLEGM